MFRLLLHTAIVFYTLSIGVYLAIYVFKKLSLLKPQIALILMGFVFETAYIVWRWFLTEHPPVFGSFENGLAASWVLILLCLLLARSQRFDFIYLMAPVGALALLAYGSTFSHQLFPLTLSEDSLWIDFHVTFAWLAFTSLAIAAFIGLLLLKPSWSRFSPAELPPPAVLDDLLVKYTAYAFMAFTLTLASGSYYSSIVFGRWWRWDPIESLSLVVWLLLSLIIHLRRSFGWRGAQLSWLAVAGLAMAIGAYWLMVYFPPGTTYHVFDIRGRRHSLL